MNDIKNVILNFVEREYKLPDNVSLESFDLMENGYIDSMALVQFVAILEDEFNIEFTADELLSDRFKTVAGLESLIKEKVSEI